MMQNYFIFNGIAYYSGTIIKIKASNSCVKTTEAVFLGYETDRHKYVLSYEGNKEVWYNIMIHLFLSMIPLHDDCPKHQDTMLANALRLYLEKVKLFKK
jgi:hypothetical protein